MEFKKYQHVERLGTSEVNGIENGMCYVFPKIDGTNSSLWWNGEIQAGSRKRHLTIDDDNAGFYNWSKNNVDLINFFTKHPKLRLYGEWLVPHTLKTYSEWAWRKFYVFDVMDGEEYIEYEDYKLLLDEFEIEYIPPICKVENPTYERLINQLEKNGYLIKDGEGVGEGVVIKNYSFVNKYGRTTWAKIVRNDFKTSHAKVSKVCELKDNALTEQNIVNKYVTRALVEKEFSKIENEDGWSSKYIPRLLNVVYYCLVKEECWNFVKDLKQPTVDFKRLYFFTVNKVKEFKPELF
jgi:DNA-binding PadR family transcriptional regulator